MNISHQEFPKLLFSSKSHQVSNITLQMPKYIKYLYSEIHVLEHRHVCLKSKKSPVKHTEAQHHQTELVGLRRSWLWPIWSASNNFNNLFWLSFLKCYSTGGSVNAVHEHQYQLYKSPNKTTPCFYLMTNYRVVHKSVKHVRKPADATVEWRQ